jgi:hypothetical protein
MCVCGCAHVHPLIWSPGNNFSTVSFLWPSRLVQAVQFVTYIQLVLISNHNQVPPVLSKFFVVFLSPRLMQCQYLRIRWQLFLSNSLSSSHPWLCNDSIINKTRNVILYIFADYHISRVLSFNFTPSCHVSIFRSCLLPGPPFLFHEHGRW